MKSLWFRLTLAFVLVAAVAVGVVALLLAQGTEQEFGRYVQRGGRQRAQLLAPTLAEYYAQNQSLAGCRRLPDLPGLPARRRGAGRRARHDGPRRHDGGGTRLR